MATYPFKQPEKDRGLGERLIAAAHQRVLRLGYRRMWRALQLNIPRQRPRRRRCGSDMRLPDATQPNSIWNDDLAHNRRVNGRASKMPCAIDE